MAEITTSTVDFGKTTFWDLPKGKVQGVVPRGEIVFSDPVVPVAAKINTDTSKWLLQLNLPRNFVYKLVELDVTVRSTAPEVSDDWTSVMPVLISADIAGVSSAFSHTFILVNLTKPWSTPAASAAFRFSTASTLRYINEFRALEGLPRYFINAQEAARLFLTFIDPSNDSTTAIQIGYYARFLIFDVEALNTWEIHEVTPQ